MLSPVGGCRYYFGAGVMSRSILRGERRVSRCTETNAVRVLSVMSVLLLGSTALSQTVPDSPAAVPSAQSPSVKDAPAASPSAASAPSTPASPAEKTSDGAREPADARTGGTLAPVDIRPAEQK